MIELRAGRARVTFWGVETVRLVKGRAWYLSLWPMRLGFYVAWWG